MARLRVLLDDEAFCLDAVPAWERSLAIRFADDDFAQAATVGEVWAVVEKRLLERGPFALMDSCTCQRTFYRLRHALTSLGQARADITPRVDLRSLFPLKSRQQRWKQLQQASDLPLPALRVAPAVFSLIWAGATAAMWLLFSAWWMAIGLGLAVACVVSSYSFVRLALPAATLGALTAEMVSAHYSGLTRARPHRQEVKKLILESIAQCGAEKEELTAHDLADETLLSC